MRFGSVLSVIALGTTLPACTPVLPPIAAGVLGDSAFKARIASVHPPGSRAAALRAELVREGFTVYDDATGSRHSALFRVFDLPCDSLVRIDWTEDRRGRIAQIQAQRHDCS